MKRRMLSLLLICCLLLSASAFAAGEQGRGAFEKGRLSGIAAMQDGCLLVTDVWNKVIWKVSGSEVSLFAGAIPEPDLTGEPRGFCLDGPAEKASFTEPWAIVPFLSGWAVSDASANVIRYLSEDGVFTLAGTGEAGLKNGQASEAAFSRPTGLAADRSGALYVSDTGNGCIRRISRKGVVETWADGLSAPTGLCWQDGVLYVAETGKNRIVRIVNGAVEHFAGQLVNAEDKTEFYGAYADGPLKEAAFDRPEGVAVMQDGSVVIADTGNAAVRLVKDGRVYTLLRGSGTAAAPVFPRGLLLQGDALTVTDAFSAILSTASVSEPAYADVPEGAWYASYAAEATRRGLINGTAPGAFSPDATTTRAMFVTMLSRVHLSGDGAAVIAGSGGFPDIPAGAWFADAAAWAIDAGVVNGMDGAFNPNGQVSREQLVTMLFRYAAAQDFSLTERRTLSGFSDAASVSAWASDAMSWAVAAGVINGVDGALAPQATATRAQVAAMLIRFMDSLGL